MRLAVDGKAGLAAIDQDSFDLVITDLMMPKLDGLSLAKSIRDVNEAMPLLTLTALGTTDDKQKGYDAVADDYLVKPFDFRELLARIKSLLKRSQTRPSINTGRRLNFYN